MKKLKRMAPIAAMLIVSFATFGCCDHPTGPYAYNNGDRRKMRIDDLKGLVTRPYKYPHAFSKGDCIKMRIDGSKGMVIRAYKYHDGVDVRLTKTPYLIIHAQEFEIDKCDSDARPQATVSWNLP